MTLCAFFHPIRPRAANASHLGMWGLAIKFVRATTAINAAERTRPPMEAAFLIQPWIATRTITDYCRLCYQARDGTGFLECKRAQLGGYNTLLASLKMETDPHFGDTLKLLEDAKEICLATRNPNDACHEKMQNTLQHTQQLYETMLDEYKNRYATLTTKPSPRTPM